jgi:hypothetical protein
MITKILVRLLAAVGAVSIIAFCGHVVVPRLASSRGPSASHSFPSPDGKYKAVLFMDAGGGMGTGYCFTKVLIIPKSYDEQKAALERNRDSPAEGRYEVYSGPCDFFDDHSESPKLNWVADNSLEISLSINSTGLFAHDFHLRKSDDSKQVNVKYVIE